MKKMVIAVFALVLLMFCMTGCQSVVEILHDAVTEAASKTEVADAADTGIASETMKGLEDYLTSVKEKADAITTSLEQEALTQIDMNLKAEELSALWDEALNHLLEEAMKILPEAEAEKLTAEQSAWAAERETAVEAAGKEVEGGSLYALVVNSEAARLTEERVYKLLEMLK